MTGNFEKLCPWSPILNQLLFLIHSFEHPKTMCTPRAAGGDAMSLSVADFIGMTTGHGFCPSPQPIALHGNKQWIFQA